MAQAETVTIEGRQLKLSNLEKLLYPDAGFSKAHVLDYYRRIAPVILPHLEGRALTLKRYPDGVEGSHFYEKQCPRYRPPWMTLKSVPRETSEGNIEYCVIDGLAGLVWVANLASIELHVLLSRSADYHKPTTMVFDLDPGPPATVIDSGRVALQLRDILADLGLESFPKTSGGKGIHLFVPLNTSVTYERTGAFSRALAELLEARNPDKVVSRMSKALRKGKVFVDWSQNSEHKTTVCAYSLRARARPTVSTPITWAELEDAVRRRKPERITFETHEVLRRVEEHGDLFAPVLKRKQRLPRAPEVDD